MKLLFCTKCVDVVALAREERFCSCGETSGLYIDDLNATYKGDHAIPFGIANNSFSKALEIKNPFEAIEFTAFLIPVNAVTLTKIKK